MNLTVLTFIVLVVGLLCFIAFYNRFSPLHKSQRYLDSLLRERLARRECLPLTAQISERIDGEERLVFVKLIETIADALQIKPGQLRLSECMLDSFRFDEKDMPPVMYQWVLRINGDKGYPIVATYAISNVVDSLFAVLGPRCLIDKGFRNEDDFEDFVLLNPLEEVILKLSKVSRSQASGENSHS